jgi:hypothetical protein
MALTDQQKLDALQAAADEGVRKVKYQDREVEYRSMKDVHAQILVIQRRIGSVSKGPIRSVVTHDKGLGGSSSPADYFGA